MIGGSRPASVRPTRLTAVIGTLDSGGAERIMALLTAAWAERGIEVTLLLAYTPPGQQPFFDPDPRVKVQRLGLSRRSSNPLDAVANNLRRLRAMRRAIRRSQPDLVLAFLTDSNVLTILASAGLHVPVVVEEHIYSAWPPMPFAWRALRRLIYPFAASVVALTPSALAVLGGAAGRHPRVIPNPVMPAPVGARAPEDPPLIVAIGRLVPQKGFDILLDAMAKLAAAGVDCRLEIWGDGPEREDLERRRDELGLGGVVSLPGRTRDPYAVLRRASLFVMSSRREGFPTVLGEAMSCGLPAVSFDCPSGPRDLIRDGVDGILVAPGDTDGLAAAMRRVLDDRELARGLAARAPEVVDRFSQERVLDDWRTLFAELGVELTGHT